MHQPHKSCFLKASFSFFRGRCEGSLNPVTVLKPAEVYILITAIRFIEDVENLLFSHSSP